ncbi:hypothetical protein DM02DRAFT_685194 [Periconia macrospinosa]|uniref:BRCT domain-containing protein n=1 Tax=Periconia macrospinosa TaxID=97972 RepID=A0A2V1DGQ6_9PLEO|nr:hypothetical protein DM02DRAFT_685194 [Periconia macrospinosa]
MASGECMHSALTEGCYDDPSQLSQLLRQRAGSGASKSDSRHSQPLFQFTKSPVDALEVPAPRITADEGLNPPPSRRVPIDLGYVQPNLLKQNSAPVSTAVDFAVERRAAQNMFNTFDVAMSADAPGDTQPDSQMFRQYTSGIVDSNSNLGPDLHPLARVERAASPDILTDEIEIHGSSQSQHSPTITSPTVMNDEVAAHDPLTSPLKFETPAVAGRKRNSQGQVLSSVINTTPATEQSATAIFGFGNIGNGNGMSLTQAFNATQARTSPIVGIPTEDPVFQRPSPNFVRRSSPPIAMSSPIKSNANVLPSSPALRSSSEPRADYETMKQSQERRSHGPPHDSTSTEHQDSWELPTAAEIRFNQRRERRIQEEQAAKLLAIVSAPKESEIVMDSQPDPHEDSPAPPHPRDFQIPSTPSTNQYSINQTTMNGHTGFTSQISQSSVPPMPPSSHTRDEMDEDVPLENARVPSSPPLITEEREGSVTYSEHAYDEHPDTAYGTDDAHPTQEDVEMEGDDGLPVATAVKHEAELMIKKDEQHTETPRSDEVPETIDQDMHNKEEELIRSSHPEANIAMDIGPQTDVAPPRIQRQSTIPESDLLEDTQPSFFPAADATVDPEGHVEGSTVDTNSTAIFHTGKEHQSVSQFGETATNGIKDNADVQSPEIPMTRSLLEIANQPGTQRSTEIEDIDLPQLSFIETDESTDHLMPKSSPVRARKKRKITYSAKLAFHSPSKESDPAFALGFSSSGKEDISKPDSTASSAPTQVREQRGASAAVRAREQAVRGQTEVTLKSRAPLKLPDSETPRKGALKPVNKNLLAQIPSRLSPRASKQPNSEALAHSTGQSKTDKKRATNSTNPVPGVTINSVAIETISNDGETPSGDVLSPNRVFAFWPGRNYYPATCLGKVDVRSFRIRYDDGNENDLECTQVCALDLRVGDQVKVDQTGMKKHAYTVVGFKDKISADDASKPHFTDRHGYATIVLEEKARDSLPAAENDNPKKYYDVPMGYVYLTPTLWGRLRDRKYTYCPTALPTVSDPRASTPTGTHGSVTHTPSMSRRSLLGQSLLRDSTTRAASVTSSVRSNGTVFSNMAFAITLTKPSSDKDGKDSIIKLITSNGGTVFEGFDELFDSPEDISNVTSGLDGLLKRDYKNLDFVALISDAHSRRLKYLQALALNIPTIHTRWINDSLNASCPLPFARYLLPSGASTYLDPAGVIISRNMPLYNPASEELSIVQILKERSLLLAHESVLFITGRSKADIERMQSSMFLTHALGPADVGQCKDLSAAKEMVDTGEWDWVYVHGGAKGVEEAAAVLFGDAKVPAVTRKRGGAATGKKRKNHDEDAEPQMLLRSGEVKSKKVRIACDEFVIQSLILGSLVEE